MPPVYVNKTAGLFSLSAMHEADQLGESESPVGAPDVLAHAVVETEAPVKSP